MPDFDGPDPVFLKYFRSFDRLQAVVGRLQGGIELIGRLQVVDSGHKTPRRSLRLFCFLVVRSVAGLTTRENHLHILNQFDPCSKSVQAKYFFGD